jgi:preprotein translocase subunit YajC
MVEQSAGPQAARIFLFLGFAATLLYSFRFLYIELKLHGFKKTIQKQFVVLSFGMGIFVSLATIFDAVNIIIYLTTGNPKSQVYWMNLFLLIAVEIHVFLLYLRTNGLLKLYPKYLLLFKTFFGFVELVGLLNIITGAIDVHITSEAAASIVLVTSYMLSIGVVIMDTSTALIFYNYIREQKKQLSQSSSMQSNTESTSIITSTGLWIALISLSATVILIAANISPAVNLLTCLAAVMWMNMKLRLEELSQKESRPLTQSQTPMKTLSPTSSAQR